MVYGGKKKKTRMRRRCIFDAQGYLVHVAETTLPKLVITTTMCGAWVETESARTTDDPATCLWCVTRTMPCP